MATKRELMERRATLVTQERDHLERLEKEGRALIGDDKEQYEKRAKDIGDLDDEIQGHDLRDTKLAETRRRESELSELRTREPEKHKSTGVQFKTRLAREAYDEFRVGKHFALKDSDFNEHTDAQIRAYETYVKRGVRGLSTEELRALSVGSDTQAGYLRVPNIAVAGILKNVDDATPTASLASRFMVGGAESMGVVTLDADPDDADWTAELLTGNEDSTMAFGKRELRVHPLAKRVKISNKLLQSSRIDVASYVQGRIGYKFAITKEKAYMTGNGVQKPLGVFTASNDGIPTTRDVSTGNTAASITADGLIEAKHSIKAAYWPRLRWQFHRDAIKQIRKLKLGDGNYIWQAGINDDLPSRILETPYVVNENAPNTFTTGLYVGIIGDFSYYWIADSMDMQLQVLNELYAATNQTGYIFRSEMDGQPVLAEAFARVKLA